MAVGLGICVGVELGIGLGRTVGTVAVLVGDGTWVKVASSLGTGF